MLEIEMKFRAPDIASIDRRKPSRIGTPGRMKPAWKPTIITTHRTAILPRQTKPSACAVSAWPTSSPTRGPSSPDLPKRGPRSRFPSNQGKARGCRRIFAGSSPTLGIVPSPWSAKTAAATIWKERGSPLQVCLDDVDQLSANSWKLKSFCRRRRRPKPNK